MLTISRTVTPVPSLDLMDDQAACIGETVSVGADRLAVEIVLGFRPGLDRLVILAGASPSGGKSLQIVEEAGNAVVVDGNGRRIVLEGVALAELAPGDIALKA